MVQIESGSIWIGADHDVWRCFEDGRETRMCRFGTFTLADFALKHIRLVPAIRAAHVAMRYLAIGSARAFD